MLRTTDKKIEINDIYQKLHPSQPGYDTLHMNKNQYLERQKRLFEVYKDIYLAFSRMEIIKKNKSDGYYGISLRQDYHATDYADEGYLFLLVDFNDLEPKIYLRTWQPWEWDKKTLIRFSNFTIHKKANRN